MSKTINRLTAPKVKKFLAAPNRRRLNDGANLYLQASGSWLFRWRDSTTHNLKEIGLGSAATVLLSEARAKRDAHNEALARGDVLQGARAKRRMGASSGATFGSYTATAHKTLTASFKNDKDRAAWLQSLVDYCKPLWPMPVAVIEPADVAACLAPIWTTKIPTAKAVRYRIAAVMDHARAAGVRKSGNPADPNVVKKLLPAQDGNGGNFAAMSSDALPAFIGKLRKLKTVAALALEFVVLTATRTNEVLGAKWAEIDRASATWTIPLERMKTGKKAKNPQRVALCPRALAILEEVGDQGELVFAKNGKPLHEKTLLRLLQSIAPDATTHGFRSAFMDWLHDKTAFDGALADFALGHAIPDKVAAAYRRGDALDKRREVMAAWEKFLG